MHRSKASLIAHVMAVSAGLYVALVFKLGEGPGVRDWVLSCNGVLDPILYRLFVEHFGFDYLENPWMEGYRDVAKHLYYVSALLGLLLLLVASTAIAIRVLRGMRNGAVEVENGGSVVLAVLYGILAVGALDLVVEGLSFSGFESASSTIQMIRLLHPMLFAVCAVLFLDQLGGLWTRRKAAKASRIVVKSVTME